MSEFGKAIARSGSVDWEHASKIGLRPVDTKLAEHDLYAREAVQYLISWLEEEDEPLLAMARGRHAEGHYRYRDSLMFEHSQDTLQAEAAQELADAICYIALKLRRARQLSSGV